MLELVFRKIGTPYTFDQFSDRLDRAKFWLEQCSPESVNRLRATRNWEVYDTLSETQRAEVARLYAFISAGGYTLDELNAELYAIPKEFAPANMEEKALKGVQGAFSKMFISCSSIRSAARGSISSSMRSILRSM